MIKLWLDDNCENESTPERLTPNGWIGVKTPLQACHIIKTGMVQHISFDHDLGFLVGWDGNLVARYIERLAFLDKISPITWDIHSANPVGRDNIRRAMKSAERFWSQK